MPTLYKEVLRDILRDLDSAEWALQRLSDAGGPEPYVNHGRQDIQRVRNKLLKVALVDVAIETSSEYEPAGGSGAEALSAVG